ncbi:hypothetical protein BT63DRAFT_427173 [Microthyrium microscopicum]|uniref:DUF1746 domain-containing protein n=1 Tax=Microthyrium microscopicum TaxID=703497 RepID=A0A6A6U597_9PEZI|nr:hypothetical protein BT63DRAFT_427173 [Microthyrium microscopicum]
MFTQALLSKPETTAQDPVHVYFLYVLASNALCLLWRIIFTPPIPGEATRGYLHGGILLDFVGQTGPASRLELVAHDLLVLILQLASVAAIRKRASLTKRRRPARNVESISQLDHSPGEHIPSHDSQDLDAEEQGLIREAQSPHSPESESLLRPTSTMSIGRWSTGSSSSDYSTITSDSLYNGQASIATFMVLDIVKDHYRLQSTQQSYTATRTIRSMVGVDLRSSRYTLNIPFRS